MKQTPVDSGGEAESLPSPDSLASGGKEGDACGGNADHEGANHATRTGAAFVPLDIEDAFDDYMRRTASHVERESVQYKESRRVWHAAFGRFFFYISHEVTALADEDAEKELERLGNNARDYWMRAIQDKD